MAASMIAFECREKLGLIQVEDKHVIAVASGLAILVPQLVAVDGTNVIVNASPESVRASVASQLEKLGDSEDVELGDNP